MKLILDTHVLLWWYADHPALREEWARLLAQTEERGERFGVSAMSLWEIAVLVERGRIELSAAVDAVVTEIEDHPSVAVLPLTGRIAVESTRLGAAFPRDPADRVITATARCHGLRLLTADERIRDSRVVALA